MNQPAFEEIEDRRRRFRFDTAELAATVNGSLATIVDLSLTGIGLMAQEELVPGVKYELRLVTEVGELSTQAQLIWSMPAFADASWEQLSLFRVGLRFPPLPKEQADLLLRLWKWQSKRSSRQPEFQQPEITSTFSEEELAAVVAAAAGKVDD